MTIHRQREQVRSLEEALQETRERTMQRDRPVSSNRDRQAAGVVPVRHAKTCILIVMC
jgi:hypothetical protein